MAKIVVKIADSGSTGGLADYNMLRPYKDDVILESSTVGETGGLLPITQAEYDRVKA